MIFIDIFSRVKWSKCLIQILFLFVFLPGAYSQQAPSGDVLKFSGNLTNAVNKWADDVNAKYSEYIDHPYIPKAINNELTYEAARQKLIDHLKKNTNYYSITKINTYQNLSTKLTIKDLRNLNITDRYIMFTSGKENLSKDTVFINYKDIVNKQLSYYVGVSYDRIGNSTWMQYVRVGDHLLTCDGKEVADLIFYMQHRFAVKYYMEDLESFKIIAADYQKIGEKPEISEEQRKLLIQGNAMNEKMNYDQAINYYDQAIAINPLSSPNSYYNYALIAAVAEKYELAILNMKKYLLLLPNAEDARSAQDKIYEWETFIK
jgi:tetratricopeptide (TPR) repeat protein